MTSGHVTALTLMTRDHVEPTLAWSVIESKNRSTNGMTESNEPLVSTHAGSTNAVTMRSSRV